MYATVLIIAPVPWRFRLKGLCELARCLNTLQCILICSYIIGVDRVAPSGHRTDSMEPALCSHLESPGRTAVDPGGLDETDTVRLRPYAHQVSGHSCILCFDAHTLCKPLIPREHNFYETMPTQLEEFTPQYRGRSE